MQIIQILRQNVAGSDKDTISSVRLALAKRGGMGEFPSTDTVMTFAIADACHDLQDVSFVPWKFHARNSDFVSRGNSRTNQITSISLLQTGMDLTSSSKPLLLSTLDESYVLRIKENGNVAINASTSLGILRGLQTLQQLFYRDTQTHDVYTPYVPVEISDAPKFSHRGINLDVARNYYAPSDIKRTIDAMSWNKFNRLHLHITDAQSWPLEIPALPDLARQGAYRSDLSYSPTVVADIQLYGLFRGVEVFFETDMPGHTASIALAYPDLITAFNVQPDWDTYSAEPPTGQLKLNSTAVYSFLEKLWQDLLPRISKQSSYFHTGGDEVNANAYLLDEGIRSNDSVVLKPFLQKFIDFNHQRIRAAGMTPIVWEEQLLTWNLTLGSDVIVQTWLSEESVAQTVARGHKVLAGNYNFWVSLTRLAYGEQVTHIN